ncbi:hypothetical protein FRC12_022565 [Ceratobasidium sp. 428]|nr:hypothetical protein FRC12_022565 [Ceratobasidium sp. 428]
MWPRYILTYQVPLSSRKRRRRRNRQPKPLARDFSGWKRQVLTLAKLHLFAYALLEGIYQTRLTFLQWAEEIHYETWMMLLPNVKYEAPSHDELVIMVNYLATLRGKVKDRLRSLIVHLHGFRQRIRTQADIQYNLDLFDQLYPNSFHCTSYFPREGPFESEDVGRCIAAAFFYSPSSVGAQFPDFFRLMAPTIVAFVFAVWQFCIEEWSNGWHEHRDLGSSFMVDKYEAHLARLQAMETTAPDHLRDLQQEWADFTRDYCSSSFVRQRFGQAAILHPELRPDTSRLGRAARDQNRNLDLEELDQRLIEAADQARLRHTATQANSRPLFAGRNRNTSRLTTQPSSSRRVERELDEDFNAEELEAARLASLRQRKLELARAGTPDDEDLDPPPEAPSRSPSPPRRLEYNEHGYATARSKGKGRAN